MVRSSVKFIEQIYRNNKDYRGIIFLDRDGTINEDVGYLRKKVQIKILPTVIDGIKLLNKKRIAVIVITNQPVVARGHISIKELRDINDSLVQILKKENAHIDAIYSCPHHPEREHPDIPKNALQYRIKCDCRKPGTAMYKKALRIYGLKRILGVIGDQTKDILAAKNLKTSSVIVKTRFKGEDRNHSIKPAPNCDNFLAAVKNIILH